MDSMKAKNVLVRDDETLKDALVSNPVYKMLGIGLTTNENHMYLYQVQQQLFVMNRVWLVLALLGSYGEFFNEEKEAHRDFLTKSTFCISWLIPESEFVLLDMILT